MALESKHSQYGLKKLKGSDYEIAEGQPDIRGWDVKDENGKQIGEIEELIFDENARKVRYMVVDLEDNEFDLDDREVLLPIGMAQLHKDDDDVLLPGVTAAQLSALPDYDDDSLSGDFEDKVRGVFGYSGAAGAGTAALSSTRGDEYYNHDHFNEDNLYRNRRGASDDTNTSIPVIQEEIEVGKKTVETGGMRLRSRIVENQVQEDITLREEKVSVNRTPVDRPATSADLREDTLEATERAEVPVVNKEARVVEEISLNKEVTERDEVIRDTVRNTEVDVDKLEDNTTKRNTDLDRS